MGTALTERQVRELRRLGAQRPLAFDADAAGRRPRCAGWSSPRATGMQVRVVELPEGRDPADVAIADPAAFNAALAAAGGVLAFRVSLILDAADVGSVDRPHARLRGAAGAAARCAADARARRARTARVLAPAALERRGRTARARGRCAAARPSREDAQPRLLMDAGAARRASARRHSRLASGERGLPVLERIPAEALTHADMRAAHAVRCWRG